VVRSEWRLAVQTTAELASCAGCGVWAEAHGRRTVRVRDLPIGGSPVVPCWRKRIWRCTEPACGVQTGTEQAAAISPRAVLTERAALRRAGGSACEATPHVWWLRPICPYLNDCLEGASGLECFCPNASGGPDGGVCAVPASPSRVGGLPFAASCHAGTQFTRESWSSRWEEKPSGASGT
jgi:hypothetical protein